ncbi:ABC transporter permease [Claveliimonas sp.]|uniref:ABC transporter permease n=1 Tax=Claveliimonas sp. TaxID=3076672 RepID=UPI00307C76A5
MKSVSAKMQGKDFIRNYFSFIGLILVVIVFHVLTEGNLISSRNMMNIFNNFFSIGLGAIGVMFLMSLGELDLSVGAIMGFASAMGAFSAQVHVALIIPVCLLTGLAIGALNGVMISRLKVESFIGTLAMSFIARGLTTYFLNGTVGIPLTQRMFDQSYVKIAVFLVVAIVFYLLFEYRAYGKQCRAIGASAEAARQSGVNVERVRFLAFAISGLLCGLAGFFSLVRTCTASSSTGEAFEFEVLLAVLFGGMPLSGGWSVKFRAAIVGSIAMAVMQNGMSLMGIDGLTQQIVEGVILIIVVVISFDRRNTVVIK